MLNGLMRILDKSCESRLELDQSCTDTQVNKEHCMPAVARLRAPVYNFTLARNEAIHSISKQ
jgi:hypothetical protein